MTQEDELEFVKNDRDKVFQSLQLAKLQLKKLKIEIGVLESEKSELQHLINQEKKLNSKEKIELKRDAYYQQQKKEILSLRDLVSKLRKDKEGLIIKLVNQNIEQ